MENGDIIRLDPGPSIHKYNADICRSFVVGDARPGQDELFSILKKGHDLEMKLIGPGVRMCDVFNKVMAHMHARGLENYVRGHFGHSVGCMKFVEEYPFISPPIPAFSNRGWCYALKCLITAESWARLILKMKY